MYNAHSVQFLYNSIEYVFNKYEKCEILFNNYKNYKMKKLCNILLKQILLYNKMDVNFLCFNIL